MQIIRVLFLAGIAFACMSPSQSVDLSENKKDKPLTTKEIVADTVPQTKQKKDTISIIGVGDIMLGSIYPNNGAYLAPNDGKDLLLPVTDILKNADITFGNHEGTLYDGVGIPKKCSDPTKCYAFKSPERYVNYLTDAGFDVMSIANNHAGDFGEEARKATYQALEKSGIKAAGSLSYPYTIFEKDGVKYAMAAFAPNTGCPSINDVQAAVQLIAELDKKADIVIVSFHGGAEGRTHQHVTKTSEIFYGENRGNVYDFSHKLIDAGADIVFGHGPHVTRALELYKGKIISYSLGNFATYGRFNLQAENGVAPILKVYVDSKGNFINGQIFPIMQIGEGGPQSDPDNKVIKILQNLTFADFPDTPLFIAEDGKVTIKK